MKRYLLIVTMIVGFAWVLSGDGRFLTVTYVDTSLNEPFAGVTIYQRQEKP